MNLSVVLSIIYNNIVLAKLTAEIWEYGDITKKVRLDKNYKHSDDQTGLKQTNSLDVLTVFGRENEGEPKIYYPNC